MRRELDRGDVLDGLASIGVEYQRISQYEIKVRCLSPDHPDQNPSMHINIGANPGVFICRSCGFNGHIMTVFKEHGYDPFDTNISLSEQTRRSMNRIKVRQEVAHVKQPRHFFPGEPWSRGDWRGIPEAVLVNFFHARLWVHTKKDGSVRHDSEGKPVERILFPVLLRRLYYGFVARYLGNDPSITGDDKYYNDPGLATKHMLFPYDLAKPKTPLFLVEGPFDAIRLRVLGYSALCIFGTQTWSDSKVMSILRLRAPQIVLMLDADVAGNKAAKTIFQSLIQFISQERIVQFPMLPGHDPGDVPEDYLLSTLQNIPRYPLKE